MGSTVIMPKPAVLSKTNAVFRQILPEEDECDREVSRTPLTHLTHSTHSTATATLLRFQHRRHIDGPLRNGMDHVETFTEQRPQLIGVEGFCRVRWHREQMDGLNHLLINLQHLLRAGRTLIQHLLQRSGNLIERYRATLQVITINRSQNFFC